MARGISVEEEHFPIAGSFTISRGSKTSADVLTCVITDGEAAGRGECVPYKRYGETLEGVRAAIEQVAQSVREGARRRDLLSLMPAGAVSYTHLTLPTTPYV